MASLPDQQTVVVNGSLHPADESDAESHISAASYAATQSPNVETVGEMSGDEDGGGDGGSSSSARGAPGTTEKMRHWEQSFPELPPVPFAADGSFNPEPFILARDDWQKDSESNKCRVCAGAFSFTVRRHHCRTCGGLVCASCSPKHPLTSERCCTLCAIHLTTHVFDLRRNGMFHGM